MKIKTNSDVVSSNIGTSRDFTIKNSAIAFQVLSDGLYSDSISAIIRELSCNAHDSHLESGQTKPFEVCLPTSLNPVFSVEDFGLGMPKEQVERLYSSFFDSTKSHTDDFTGGFGLGSKSPFSYTDAFNVQSRYDGMEYEYLCHTDGGLPKITLLREEPTSECNGVKISIPVETGDIYSFVNSAPKQLSFFPKGSIEVKGPFSPIQYTDLGNYLNLGRYRRFSSTGSQYSAAMGPVVYELNPNHLGDEFRRLFWQDQIVLKFNVGDLSITPSREQLKYDERTITAIEKRGNELCSSFFQDSWETTFKGKEVDHALIHEADQFRKYSQKFKDDYLAKIIGIADTVFESDKPFEYYSRLNRYGRAVSKVTRSTPEKFQLDRQIVVNKVLVIDVAKGFISRIQKYMIDNDLKTCAVVEASSDNKKVVKSMGFDSYILVSSMPEVEKSVKSRGISRKARQVEYKGRSYTVTDEDIKNGFYYVWTYRGNVTDNITDQPADVRSAHSRHEDSYNGKPVFRLSPANKSLAKHGKNLFKEFLGYKPKTTELLKYSEFCALICKLGYKVEPPCAALQFLYAVPEGGRVKIKEAAQQEVMKILQNIDDLRFVKVALPYVINDYVTGGVKDYIEKRITNVLESHLSSVAA